LLNIFRSETIIHNKIRIPRDNSTEIMDSLGKLVEAIEFIDLTKDDIEAKKNFSSMIKRCEDLEKKIKYCNLFTIYQ